MSAELVVLLRQRVANRFYDDPRVIDAVARAIMPSFQGGNLSPQRGLGIYRDPSRTIARS